MKRKLFFLITKSNWGGAQRYVYDLATHMPENLYDITVVLGAPRVGSTEGGKGVLLERLHKKNIRTITIAELARDINLWEEIIVFWKLLRLFSRERPDIIHTNSSKMGGLATVAGRIVFIRRVIFTVHGWPFQEERTGWQKSLIRFFSWLTVIFAHKTIVIGEHDFALGQTLPLVGKKLAHIGNGIEPHGMLSRADTRSIIAQHITDTGGHPPPIDGTWIGTIAELTGNKGHLYAIRGFAGARTHFNKMYYFIFGGGSEREGLEELIESLGLSGKVFLLGFVPNVAHMLPAFDIVLLASVKEGLPYVLLEAGCVGLPVIATSVGDIPSLIENYRTGLLIPSKNVARIAESLEKLGGDTILRNRLGKNLKTHVFENFSLKKMLKQTISLYKT